MAFFDEIQEATHLMIAGRHLQQDWVDRVRSAGQSCLVLELRGGAFKTMRDLHMSNVPICMPCKVLSRNQRD